MTAEVEVHKEVASKVELQEKPGLDLANGTNGTSAKEDADSSYVFVNGNDALCEDPVEADPNGHANGNGDRGDNGGTRAVPVEDHNGSVFVSQSETQQQKQHENGVEVENGGNQKRDSCELSVPKDGEESNLLDQIHDPENNDSQIKIENSDEDKAVADEKENKLAEENADPEIKIEDLGGGKEDAVQSDLDQEKNLISEAPVECPAAADDGPVSDGNGDGLHSDNVGDTASEVADSRAKENGSFETLETLASNVVPGDAAPQNVENSAKLDIGDGGEADTRVDFTNESPLEGSREIEADISGDVQERSGSQISPDEVENISVSTDVEMRTETESGNCPISVTEEQSAVADKDESWEAVTDDHADAGNNIVIDNSVDDSQNSPEQGESSETCIDELRPEIEVGECPADVADGRPPLKEESSEDDHAVMINKSDDGSKNSPNQGESSGNHMENLSLTTDDVRTETEVEECSIGDTDEPPPEVFPDDHEVRTENEVGKCPIGDTNEPALDVLPDVHESRTETEAENPIGDTDESSPVLPDGEEDKLETEVLPDGHELRIETEFSTDEPCAETLPDGHEVTKETAVGKDELSAEALPDGNEVKDTEIGKCPIGVTDEPDGHGVRAETEDKNCPTSVNEPLSVEEERREILPDQDAQDAVDDSQNSPIQDESSDRLMENISVSTDVDVRTETEISKPSIDVIDERFPVVDTIMDSDVKPLSVADTSIVTDVKSETVESKTPGNVSLLTESEILKDAGSEHNELHRTESSRDSPVVSTIDAEGQNATSEVAKKRLFHLVRIPRYDDGNLKEEIRLANITVDERTRTRDAIRAELQKQRATCKEYYVNFDSAASQEKALRELLKSKRQEIDSLQSIISLDDIDGKIRNMEHMIEHETLPLREEKQFIREIKQLKQAREQLCSNMGRQVQQKDQSEERMKSLKKEVDLLRGNILKVEPVAKAARKKYCDENDKLDKLLDEFRAADDIRQKAYSNLQELKKQLYQKNKYFWQYKDDLKTARDLASKRDVDALDRFSVNQVEEMMERWNKNDEFRRDYVRCNMNSTLRRLKTLDGRSLGPDEEPPVLNERATNISVSTSIQESEPPKQVEPAESVKRNDNMMNAVVQKNPAAKSKKSAKPAPPANSFATASGRDEIEEATEKEQKRSKEEEELIRKAEELRKEEEAAKLKEQQRLEEKAKAKEALERKTRIAEKAQARAALKAQREAEQKEKEREKRARKKERRKAKEIGIPENEVESAPTSETPTQTSIETETKEKDVTWTKRPSRKTQYVKQTKAKSIPLPLRSRGKRRIQSWMWAVLIALVIFALFLIGNSSFSFNLGLQRLKF